MMNMALQERLILGTWQFGGDFRLFSGQSILDIFHYALDHGINEFDTAQVYGNGLIEELLGTLSNLDIEVTTKIPALKNPKKMLVALKTIIR
jgi:aryl-alcohol dehydrogenase-like predicted oxidoreductase